MKQLVNTLIVHRYLHFFITGASGAAINLAVTWVFTQFVFGLDGYFRAYILGLSVNLFYNFVLYTKIAFQTKNNHAQRLVVFITYSLVVTFIQASIVKFLTPLIGLHLYLVVIGGVIFLFSTFNFFVFRLSLFKE